MSEPNKTKIIPKIQHGIFPFKTRIKPCNNPYGKKSARKFIVQNSKQIINLIDEVNPNDENCIQGFLGGSWNVTRGKGIARNIELKLSGQLTKTSFSALRAFLKRQAKNVKKLKINWDNPLNKPTLLQRYNFINLKSLIYQVSKTRDFLQKSSLSQSFLKRAKNLKDISLLSKAYISMDRRDDRLDLDFIHHNKLQNVVIICESAIIGSASLNFRKINSLKSLKLRFGRENAYQQPRIDLALNLTDLKQVDHLSLQFFKVNFVSSRFSQMNLEGLITSKIRFDSCNGIKGDYFSFQKIPGLTKFEAELLQTKNELFLKEANSLTEISISVDSTTYVELKKLPSVKKAIMVCKNFRADGRLQIMLENLQECPSLNHLVLSCEDCTFAVQNIDNYFRNLTNLTLELNKSVVSDCQLQNYVESISELLNLEFLTIKLFSINSLEVPKLRLQNAKNLKAFHFQIDVCKLKEFNMIIFNLDHLSKLNLNLNSCSCMTAFKINLSSVPKLDHAIIRLDAGILNEAFIEFEKIRELGTFKTDFVKYNRLTNLHFSFSDIDDIKELLINLQNFPLIKRASPFIKLHNCNNIENMFLALTGLWMEEVPLSEFIDSIEAINSNIENLDFLVKSQELAKHFQPMLKKLTCFKNLNLSLESCKRLSQTWFDFTAHKTLNKLKLSLISNEALTSFKLLAPNLLEINLELDSSRISDNYLSDVIRAVRQLAKLQKARIQLLRNKSILKPSFNFKDMKTLNSLELVLISLDNLEFLEINLEGADSLKELTFRIKDFMFIGKIHCSELKELQKLTYDLSDSIISDNDLGKIVETMVQNGPNIQSVKIELCNSSYLVNPELPLAPLANLNHVIIDMSYCQELREPKITLPSKSDMKVLVKVNNSLKLSKESKEALQALNTI